MLVQLGIFTQEQKIVFKIRQSGRMVSPASCPASHQHRINTQKSSIAANQSIRVKIPNLKNSLNYFKCLQIYFSSLNNLEAINFARSPVHMAFLKRGNYSCLLIVQVGITSRVRRNNCVWNRDRKQWDYFKTEKRL